MPILEVNAGPLAYDDQGDGPPVVLLHAGIADRRMWTALARRLSERYRVVTYDLRGYGESTPAPASFAHHDDAVGLLDRLGIERATLVGNSFGGLVALDTTLAHPDRISALALLSSAVSGYRWTERQELWDRLIGEVDEEDLEAVAAAEVRFWVVGPDRIPEDLDPELIKFAEEMDRGALAAEAALEELDEVALDPPALGRLAEVAPPTLVTAGAADIPEIGRLADRLAVEIPHARRLPDIPGAAHLVGLEATELVAQALFDFLAEVSPR